MVVDNAEARVEQVLTLVDRAARSPGRVRALLLSRHAGRWWDSLPYTAQRPEPFLAASVMPLAPVALSVDDRRQAFIEAADALARHLGRDPDVPVPDLADATFDNMLLVQLAALTAVDPQLKATADQHGGSLAHRLLDEVLLREDVKHWEPTARQAGLTVNDKRRRRAVAVATLTAADDETAATAVLRTIPGVDAAQATELGEWLSSLLPDTSYLPPLRPDRLGEHLVAEVLGDLPALPAELAAVTDLRHLRRILTVLTRAGVRYASARNGLRDLVNEHAQRIAGWVLTHQDLTTGQLLARAVEIVADDTTARTLLAAIPDRTTVLLDTAVAAGQILLDTATDVQERASVLNNLSKSLAGLGRREDALAAAEEARSVTAPGNRKQASGPPVVGTHGDADSPRSSGAGRRDRGRKAHKPNTNLTAQFMTRPQLRARRPGFDEN